MITSKRGAKLINAGVVDFLTMHTDFRAPNHPRDPPSARRRKDEDTMNPEEWAEHILKNYNQATEPDAMKEAIAHVIKSNRVIRDNLHAAIENQAEETARVVAENNRLRKALQDMLDDCSAAKIEPFSAERARRLLNS
jgi:hypothetical protein